MDWVWQKPELTRAGQVAFWNRQAPIYEVADMTTDNYHDIACIVKKVNPSVHSEIVTLGGAVGCRDPLAILKAKYCSEKDGLCRSGARLPRIFFNDIAPEMVRKAEENVLASCRECGVEMEFYTGPIADACGQVKKDRSRVLFLGLCSGVGFFESDSQHGFMFCGFDEYMKNCEILGERFWFDWLLFNGESLRFTNRGFFVEPAWSAEKIANARNRLANDYATAAQSSELVALQVVSAHRDREGFFISHWFNARGILSLLREVFSEEEFETTEAAFPKGMLFAIARRNSTPTGIATILNNVLGNILPQEQIFTLNRVKDIL